MTSAAGWAQEAGGAAQPPVAENEQAAEKRSEPTQAELERRFQESLTGSTLRGHWRMTGEDGLTGNAPLSDPHPESYEIVRAIKLVGDRWLVSARIRFGGKDVTLPVPIRVVWAGDTPIITVNELSLPGLGTYSARVMIFEGFYCGTWLSKSKNYGGVMSGRIVKTPPEKPATPDTGESPAPD